MSSLHRRNVPAFVLNYELIQRIDAHPDTVVTLVDTTRYVVADSPGDVGKRIGEYRVSIATLACRLERPPDVAGLRVVSRPGNPG